MTLRGVIRRPEDARERTEDEDNPIDVALQATEGPVPDLAARLNGSVSSRPLLSAAVTAS